MHICTSRIGLPVVPPLVRNLKQSNKQLTWCQNGVCQKWAWSIIKQYSKIPKKDRSLQYTNREPLCFPWENLEDEESTLVYQDLPTLKYFSAFSPVLRESYLRQDLHGGMVIQRAFIHLTNCLFDCYCYQVVQPPMKELKLVQSCINRLLKQK